MSLTLANGVTWSIEAMDDPSKAILAQIEKAMRLSSRRVSTHRLVMRTHDSKTVDLLVDGLQQRFKSLVKRKSIEESQNHFDETWITVFEDQRGNLHCNLPAIDDPETCLSRVMQISDIIVLDTLNTGGVLVHGALVEREGRGFILAGAGGVGKTTASSRMPVPWRTRCDDLTLVVQDRYGIYWAHPWPTWSRFLDGGGGSWDVENAVPLSAVFILTQAGRDQVQAMDEVESLCILLEHTQHSGFTILRGLDEERKREIHLQRFNNLCALVNMVPCYRLWISLRGAFWLELEREIVAQEVMQQAGIEF